MKTNQSVVMKQYHNPISQLEMHNLAWSCLINYRFTPVFSPMTT